MVLERSPTASQRIPDMIADREPTYTRYNYYDLFSAIPLEQGKHSDACLAPFDLILEQLIFVCIAGKGTACLKISCSGVKSKVTRLLNVFRRSSRIPPLCLIIDLFRLTAVRLFQGHRLPIVYQQSITI